MDHMDYSDQHKIFNPQEWTWPVHLIGAGGINNAVAFVLAKMGITELHVWDDDILETHNCPTEIGYSCHMVGRPKVVAMDYTLRFLMGDDFHIVQHQARVTKRTKLSGIVVCGVDSMQSRSAIWEAVKKHYLDIPLFIDGRSGGEETSIFAFPPADFESVDAYETWLFDDSEALQLECGARNIGYISAYMATEIPRIITRFHRNLDIEFHTIRDFSQK